jgi:hypothetical protein
MVVILVVHRNTMKYHPSWSWQVVGNYFSRINCGVLATRAQLRDFLGSFGVPLDNGTRRLAPTSRPSGHAISSEATQLFTLHRDLTQLKPQNPKMDGL